MNNKIIIDIRDSNSYNNGNISGSINILENKLLLNPSYYLDKNKEYIIYCDYGNRSRRVVNYLNRIGYKAYNLDGGYDNYVKNN